MSIPGHVHPTLQSHPLPPQTHARALEIEGFRTRTLLIIMLHESHFLQKAAFSWIGILVPLTSPNCSSHSSPLPFSARHLNNLGHFPLPIPFEVSLLWLSSFFSSFDFNGTPNTSSSWIPLWCVEYHTSMWMSLGLSPFKPKSFYLEAISSSIGSQGHRVEVEPTIKM